MEMNQNMLPSYRRADTEMTSLIFQLKKLIMQPSISAKNEGLDECAYIVNEMMHKAGINSTVYKINTKIPPIVYGEIQSKCNPKAKTLLFYNHYDVQPIDPIQAWSENPFGGNIKGNKIFGRGASDDKGELVTRIKAVECILKEKGDVPCNIKFFVEGEEEIGSPNIKRYIQMLKHKIYADAIIWEFGYIDTKNRPIINLGMKGMLYIQLLAYGASVPLHSSLAVLVKNPAWNLVKALVTLWDDKAGTILIKDWYNEAKGFRKEELDFVANQPIFDEIEFKTKYKIGRFLGDIKGANVRTALAGKPTCNISSITTGELQQNEIRTVIPSVAKANIDFRLVPAMEPQKQFERLGNHLKQHGFGSIHLKYIQGVKPSRTPPSHPFVRIARNSAEKSFGANAIINLSSAGSGPMHYFSEMFRCPCIALGCTSIYANIHSYDEYARIDLLNKGIKCIVSIIESMSE